MPHAAGQLAAGRDEGAALVVAHRGAWAAAPQNSLAAVRDAIALGCDGVEIDVRRTADGRLVVLHDARVRGRAVEHLEHAELIARLPAGQAPLLADVLALVAEGGIAIDVELKQDGIAAPALEAVRAALAPQRYVVTSFDAGVLAEVAALDPGVRTGLLLGPRRHPELARRVRSARAHFLAPHVSLARGGVFAWAAERGLALWVWTVNDERALSTALADPRVEAVITDAPRRALELAHGA